MDNGQRQTARHGEAWCVFWCVCLVSACFRNFEGILNIKVTAGVFWEKYMYEWHCESICSPKE